MSTKKRSSVAIVVYEGGRFLCKFRLLPGDPGTDIEQTSLQIFSPNATAFNFLMVAEQLVNDMWKGDVRDLMDHVSNDIADEEFHSPAPPTGDDAD